MPLLICSGSPYEASAFVRRAGVPNYAIVTESYHVKQHGRGETLVLVGSWSSLPSIRRVQDEARRRGCPIFCENDYLEKLTKDREAIKSNKK